ncbi:MAG: hypothetical protein BWK73_31440 [Thiothrix lacustris]|uniref:Sugar 3,4-ketoisomerase QdtA cupin domain-containing protein n=1 Tax=Thiothrix lacustris TaxID=525917 RepID=A0A1Y1QI40_9GAMM|nr:MAG: hypothetical protein BWK73_31440 [Thiothrix lacustris]
MLETITVAETTLAIILRRNFQTDGIHFFTPDDFSQQLAYMNRPSGYVIQPHVHNSVKREVHFTKEVLLVRSGKVRVDFYDDAQHYLASRVLDAGDVILLAYGGHGFTMIEPSEIIEIKQGPFAGDGDKTRFTPMLPAYLNYGEPDEHLATV